MFAKKCIGLNTREEKGEDNGFINVFLDFERYVICGPQLMVKALKKQKDRQKYLEVYSLMRKKKNLFVEGGKGRIVHVEDIT